jgi:hypothetical protein
MHIIRVRGHVSYNASACSGDFLANTIGIAIVDLGVLSNLAAMSSPYI